MRQALLLTIVLALVNLAIAAVPPLKDLPVLPVMKDFPILDKPAGRPRDYDTWSKKRQLWWNFSEAIRSSQFATAQRIMKDCLLFDERCPAPPGSSYQVGMGAGIDETLAHYMMNRVYYTTYTNVRYAALFTLVKETVDQDKRRDLHLADLYQCFDLMERCDFWKHKLRSDTTEPQRKAIRLWMLQTLVAYAETVLASPNSLREPEVVGVEQHQLGQRERLCKMVRDGAVAPNPDNGRFTADKIEKYRAEWFNWYGDVPPEILKLEKLSKQIADLRLELIKLMDQKRAVQRAVEKAKQIIREDPLRP